MKATEIRNMTRDEIIHTLNEKRDEHFKLRMRRTSEELPNPIRLRLLKRDIARLETILKEMPAVEKTTSATDIKQEKKSK